MNFIFHTKRLFNISLVCFCIAFAANTAWGGGSVVGNGGGIAEQNILFAWFHLPAVLKSCRQLKSCYETTALQTFLDHRLAKLTDLAHDVGVGGDVQLRARVALPGKLHAKFRVDRSADAVLEPADRREEQVVGEVAAWLGRRALATDAADLYLDCETFVDRELIA